ncbi:hypothetical protein, variant [Plasmodium falciparum Tanzania (2000708)]|uniref:Bms1-type G domain-containing protein n=1 Tax=Plasmodium falciparum Tanzania (2000708) TaxID=1036725 RepID=A0A024WE91_PLAFA|nr:hypothetical protein, variant [Plasmodium falciparum Tanzania (2000708)]
MDDKKKHHKKKKVGKKSKKKKINKNGNNKKYHKAFAFSGGIKSAHRRKQHLFELEEKKLRVQKVYKEGNKSSPLIVVIQGAKGVGKSTLLKSLIKYYVGITINNIKGPISIFTKNLKRYTFIEVNDDILHMIDVAKIADICILVIDGSYGIELETLEFLNILYTHGLPKVLGVVTHLDKFKDSKSIRKRKKKLNKRYSEELVEGSKLFFLSGIQNNRYNKTEIRNLCKFLSVIKKPIISWREQHGYILGLKLDVDDLLINNQITSQKNNLQSEHVHNENYVNHASYDNDNDNDEENEKKLTNFLTNCDEKIKISIEGYVYGSKIYKNQKVHIPNIGDVEIDNIQILQEPFKLDEQKKNPNIYAPMSDVGNLTFDFDNMYIHIPKNKVNFTREEFLLADQREETIPGDHSGEKNGNTLKDDEGGGDGDDDDDDVGDDNVDDDDGNDDDDDDNDDDDNDDDDNDDDDDDDNENSDKSSHHNKQSNDNEKYITDSIKMIRELQKSNGVFSKQQKDNLILFNETNDNNGASNIRRKAPSNVYISEKQKKKKQQDSYVNEKAEEYNKLESILYEKKNNDEEYYCANNVTISSDDDKEENDASFREFYRKYGLNADMSDDGGNNDINIYNGQESEEKLKDTYDKLIDGGDDEDDYDDDENVDKDKGNIGNEINIKENLKKLKEEKLIEKEKFRETEKIGVLNSGYGSSVNIGEYVRIELNIEKKKLAILKNNLIICGGIQTYEEKDSLIHCRIKKHRWFPKLLRSNDPLIFSVGWRRYQSIPIYSISERNNVRLRYLKYTTEHMHCNCTFYGPLASVNSGILALYNYKKVPFYRICINGLIIETNNNLNIMKKLKLIGEPYKIFKNTAFVKNMFNSDLEVCKFLNCPVVTPSGIKGLIKNKINNNGDFRCTFADKIRMSDIVILKLYVNVKIKKFYYFDIENKIKSINELRYLYNIYVNHNNNYRSIPFRHFYHTKIQIKSKLLKDLPFKSKPKLFKKLQNHANLNNKQLTNNINNKKTKTDQINFNALPNPKLAAKWYQMLHTIKKNILDQKKAKSQLSYHKKLKEKLKIQQAKTQVVKQRKKISYKKGRK